MTQTTVITRFLSVVRLLLAIGAFGLMVWLVFRFVVPTGHLTLHYRPAGASSSLIENFASKEKDIFIGRSKEGGDPFQLITQEPVYFDVRVPRPFAKAKVTVAYQNPNDQPEIKLGVGQKNGGIYFTNLALHNAKLDQLPDYWTAIRDGKNVLLQKDTQGKVLRDKIQAITKDIDFQREELDRLKTLEANGGDITQITSERNTLTEEMEKLQAERAQIESEMSQRNFQPRYGTINDFLSQPPEANSIGRFNFDLNDAVHLAGYQPAAGTRVIDRALRGSHTMYTYLKDETLDFTFNIQEMNRFVGPDECLIEVWRGSTKVSSTSVNDDGNIGTDGKASLVQSVEISVPELAEGVYQIKVISRNEEHLIRRIETAQHVLVFQDHIFLADNQEYGRFISDIVERPTTLYGSGGVFIFRTSHPSGRQMVTVDQEQLSLADLNIDYSTQTQTWANRFRTVTSAKNDLYIRSNGYFFFEPEQYFDPNVGVANLNDMKSIDERDYIVANYPERTTVGGWEVASQTVEVPFLYTDDNRIHFLLNLPGLTENKRVLKIKEVTIELEKEPITLNTLWNKLKEKLK